MRVIRGNHQLAAFIFIASILLIGTLTTNQAFANHLSEEMKWQVVVISSYPACGNSHYQMMVKFDEIIEKYLNLYNLENSKYEPTCFPDSKYMSDYISPADLDLIVLVYDRNLGEKELHSQNMGGLYSHTGIDRTHNHAILICGDCPTFYYSNPVWILSHELSHFVLFYKDYEMSVIEDLVHSFDKKYDKCMESYDDSCKPSTTKLSGLGYDYSVMPIYKPAIDNNYVSALTNDEVPEIVLDLTKVITKWWADGKITDGDFANAIGFVIDEDVISSHGEAKILFADEPIKDEVTWDEMISDITPNYWDRPAKTEDNTKDILSRVPYKFKSEENIIFEDDIPLGIPEWFKNTAIWWVEEKITNEEMMKSVEYLREAGIIRPRY